MKRCAWVSLDDPLMLAYHDHEWGVPVHDDRTHFEFLVLEAAQAGLSWSIVLRKREGYRRAFSEFDPEKVARYSEQKIREAHVGCGHHPKPDEDRGCGTRRAGVSSHSERVRQLRCLLLALCRRTAKAESSESNGQGSRHLNRIRRIQQGFETPGVQFRWFDHHVRVHAGGRHGK